MAGHPQGTIRGLIVKGSIQVGAQALTANSTAVITSGALQIAGKKYVNANSTGFLFSAVAAKPTTRSAGYNWTFVTNSTGVSGIGIRTTGTTWKYANVTSVLPT